MSMMNGGWQPSKKGPGRKAGRKTQLRRATKRLRPAQGQGNWQGKPYESYACADAKRYPRSSLEHAYGFDFQDIAYLDDQQVDLLMNEVQTKLGQGKHA